MVPVEAVPPATEVGEKASADIPLGFNVSVVVTVEAPRVALMDSVLDDETAEVEIEKDFAVDPEGIVTVAG